MNNDMRYVYTGNVHDEDGGSIWYRHCGAKLIGRDWYQLTAWNIDRHGACLSCHTEVPGVLERESGDWGRRRMPVQLASIVA